MSQVHHTPKGELSRAPRIASVEEFMPCSWNLPSFPFLHPFSISLNFLYPPGHAGCELEETKAMLKYPRLQKEVLKNPQGFWLTALSCKLFRDWKTDKGPSSEMLQDLQNPSERNRILTPSTGEARQGQGGSLPPALQCGMRGTPPKHNVRGFGGIFGSCSGFRGDVLYPWSSCSTFAWKQFSLLEAQPWCWFTPPEAKLCCFCFILPLHHLSQSLLQLLSSVSSEFKTALALWLLNS